MSRCLLKTVNNNVQENGGDDWNDYTVTSLAVLNSTTYNVMWSISQAWQVFLLPTNNRKDLGVLFLNII